MKVLHYINLGGWFIYPLILLSMVMVTVIIERAIYFFALEKKYSLLSSKLKTGNNSPDLSAYFDLVKTLKVSKDPKTVLSLFLEDEYHENTRHFGFLSFTAATAPLFGLLGTIAGIMVLFRKIEMLGYNTDPSMLSGGIWQAIITTLSGLIIAIPAIGFLQYFDSRSQKALLKLKKIISDARGNRHQNA